MTRTLITLMLACMLGAMAFPTHAQSDRIWTLRECLEHAKEHNLSLQIAQLGLQSNDVALQRARAARLPNLNAGGNFTANFGYAINPFTNEFSSAGNQAFNLGLNSGVTLYNGGRLTQTINQASMNQRISELDLKQAEYDLALNISLAYLDILRNQELVKSAEVQLASNKEQRDRTDKLVKAGVNPMADLLQIESQIATDELNLINARNNVESSYLVLMQLLQLDASEPFGISQVEVEVPENDIFQYSVSEIYREAAGNLPGIQSADLQVESDAIGEKIAKTGLLPSLTASGNIGTGWASGRQLPTGETITLFDTTSLAASFAGSEYQQISIANSFEDPIFEDYTFQDQLTDNISASVSLGFSIPIYNRYQNSAAIQQAELSRVQSSLQADLARQQLQQDIQTAYVQARSSYSSYKATEKQIRSLELTFENAQKQFELGVLNSVDYLIAKNNLQRAQNDLVRSKYNYVFRVKVLDFYRGRPIGF